MHDKHQIIEEPCEVKVSRTVLKTSGAGDSLVEFNPCCGYKSKENRPNQGLTFVCQQCGYTLHADLVGARNVALRVLLYRQEWESTGRFSAVPDASGDETKTDYRIRYSGLRWSQDAIPILNVAESSDEAK